MTGTVLNVIVIDDNNNKKEKCFLLVDKKTIPAEKGKTVCFLEDKKWWASTTLGEAAWWFV